MCVCVCMDVREKERKEKKKKKGKKGKGKKKKKIQKAGRREGRNRLVRRGLRVTARVSEHRSSIQGNSDRISSQEAVMSMDGCGKAGLGCKPSGIPPPPPRGTCKETKETHRFIPGADSRNQSAEGEAV